MKDALICSTRGRDPDKVSYRGRSNGRFRQLLEIGGRCANTITSVAKDNFVLLKY